jgi:hypothetical protein
MLLVTGLGRAERLLEIVIVKFGIDHLEPIANQMRWLDSTWNAVPTVKKQNFHIDFLLAEMKWVLRKQLRQA